MQSYLASLGIPFEFVFGVDARKLSPRETASIFDAEQNRRFYYKTTLDKNRGMTNSEIGCALSHRLVYQKMIENNVERAVLLEDDIQLHEDFLSVLGLLSLIKINNYLIKFDVERSRFVVPWHKIKLNETYTVHHSIAAFKLTWGYYLDIKAAHTMYNKTQKIFVTADEWEYFRDFVNLRMLNRALVDENKSLALNSLIGKRPAIHRGALYKINRMYHLGVKFCKSIFH
jgi:GR25 family glycosyltransferase involved in LPS biosynthesis